MSTELDIPRKVPSMMLAVCVLTLAYVAGYGIVRWQNLLTHNVYMRCPIYYPPSSWIHTIDSSSDLGAPGAGSFKNQIAVPVAVIYSPLGWIEAALWTACDSR